MEWDIKSSVNISVQVTLGNKEFPDDKYGKILKRDEVEKLLIISKKS